MSKQTLEIGGLVVDGKTLLDLLHPVGSIFETTSSDFDTVARVQAYFGGTWEVFGAGMVVVGYLSDDDDFKTIGGTGGSKALQEHTHDFTPTGSVGAHLHTYTPVGTVSGGAHTHGLWSGGANGANCDGLGWDGTETVATRVPGGHGGWGSLKTSECGYKKTFYASATQQSTMDSERHVISVETPSYTFSAASQKTNSSTPTFTGTQGTTVAAGSGKSGNLQPYIVVYRYRRTA